MFRSAQFTITKLWNQPRCPSTEEWITKLWEIYTMEFYSAIKKNEIMSFARKCKEGPGEHSVEISQSQKVKGYVFSNM